MFQPEELKKSEPREWSPGTGAEVWELLSAVVSGDLASVKRQISAKPELIQSSHDDRNAMYFAVRENRLDIAAYLIERGADAMYGGMDEPLPQIAGYRGHLQMKKLLEDALGSKRISPRAEEVGAAIRERDLVQVRARLDASPDLLHTADTSGNQPIHWAVMTRQPEMIDELLSRGADINANRFDGARPVQLFNGHYSYRGWRDVPKEITATPADILAHLKSRGAYIDICTASHMGDVDRMRELLLEDAALANRLSDYVTYYLGSGSPLRNAAARGHMEIVKLLLDHGADPNLPEPGIAPRGHALYSAVYNGHHEVARLLLERGAYASAPVESSADALSIAMMNKDDKMVELLCSYGAARSVDILAYYGDTKTAAAVFAANPALADDPGAFGNAAGNGNEAFVRLMLHHQPGLIKRVSCGAKTRELTEYLFERGMPVSLPDLLGVTTLHRLAARGDVQNAAAFIDHGAEVNALDEDLRSTPLGWAARRGKSMMVELLLRRGANPNLPADTPWATPLAWATRGGHREAVELLEQFQRTGALPAAGVERFEKAAQDVAAAYNTGEPAALQRITERFAAGRPVTRHEVRMHLHQRLRRQERPEETLSPEDARFIVAQSQGFETWQHLVDYVGTE